jgi:hypothetical protein
VLIEAIPNDAVAASSGCDEATVSRLFLLRIGEKVVEIDELYVPNKKARRLEFCGVA